MASTSMAVQMAMPLTSASQKRIPPTSSTFFKPLPVRPSKTIIAPTSSTRVQVQASLKEKAIAGLTAATLTATMVIPEVAEAAGSDLSPSLKNFLLSIVAGGVVLTAILGAVIGVSNFDPVKRT
ncbi:Photosystem II PsbX [Macleaya cordata]|uniref:Photosystem II PsbX n=1 Tax=Macleaya cordata TaxID=56857 RepID=A0A200QMZ8_MACCD|nr:Photosystem II PsbX [Macleaya cordata]